LFKVKNSIFKKKRVVPWVEPVRFNLDEFPQ
jgi:hypothetical protein